MINVLWDILEIQPKYVLLAAVMIAQFAQIIPHARYV